MAFSLACLTKWTIYALAILTIALAIATITLDIDDNNNRGNTVPHVNNQPPDSRMFSIIVSFLLMISVAGLAVLHLFFPRLFLIILMGIMSIATLISRFFPWFFHISTTFVLIIDALVGFFYVYWVGFHLKEDKNESIWKTMTKVDLGGRGRSPSKAVGESYPNFSPSKKESHQKKGSKDLKKHASKGTKGSKESKKATK